MSGSSPCARAAIFPRRSRFGANMPRNSSSDSRPLGLRIENVSDSSVVMNDGDTSGAPEAGISLIPTEPGIGVKSVKVKPGGNI